MTTAVQRKIDAFKGPKPSSLEYIRAVWHTMIAFGVCTQEEPYRDHWSYYGNDWNTDRDAGRDLIERLEGGVEIDYSASDDPASMQDWRSGFRDTFASSQYLTPVMWGQIVLKDGSTFTMGIVCPEDGEFANIVKVLGLEITLKEAVEHAKDRLDHGYSQELPYLG